MSDAQEAPPADESKTPPPADDAGADKMGLKDGPPADDPPADGSDPNDTTVPSPPDWLSPKYKTVEDQAKAYTELEKKLGVKNEDILKQHFQELGVPDAPDGYEYPEGWDAPAETIDDSFRDWAKRNNVSSDAFKDLVDTVWRQTMPDPDEEWGKLGENAEQRVKHVSGWVRHNIDEAQFGVVDQIMRTAAGVEFMEGIIQMNRSFGFAPGADDAGSSRPLTREGIRELMRDPRYENDKSYQEMISKKWKAFEKQEANRR